MGACVWFGGLRIATPIGGALGGEGGGEELSRVIRGDDAPLLGILLASAVVPALCEELLHRGLLLPGLVAWLGRAGGVIAGAALFAVIHIEPARMASTFVIGVLAGVLALRTRSLWPVIAFHLVNNASALLVATSDGDPVTAAIAAHPGLALTVAIAGTIAGLGVATWASPARSHQS
jgi:membrane protease YdiL (CAAX protease family)